MAYLLELGLPIAVFDNRGNSAITFVVKAMPDVAYEALMQYMELDLSKNTTEYHLDLLEYNARHGVERPELQPKTVLEVKIRITR